MSTSHFKVSRHKVVEVPKKYVVSEDEKLSSQVLTQEEISIVKIICKNPIFKKKETFTIKKSTTLKKIRLDICNFYEITEDEFLSQRRDATLINARREFCHYASKINRAETSKIAKLLNKDYGTVYNYLKQPSPETDKLLQSFNDSEEK